MTKRERIKRCYFNLETDRPAVYSRTGFPPGDSTYDCLKQYIRQHTELKTGWSASQFEMSYSFEVLTQPHSEDFIRQIKILHTPKGDLRSSCLQGLKGQPGLDEKFLVNSAEDAECYLSLPFPKMAESGSKVDLFFSAEAAIGEEGIVDVCLGYNPGGFAASLCGSENFAMMSITERDAVHSLCLRRMEIMLDMLKFLLSQGIGPFFSMLGQEYIVPPLHGPEDFRDFNVKYDKPIIDLIHDAGGRVHVHSHGSIRKVFMDFVEMGVDVLHPFEAPPCGDILPCEAKEFARGRMCLEGNIQISRMYETSPEEIREETRRLIADAFDDGRGLIVSPTASPYIRGKGRECFPRYKAMIDAVTGR